MSTTYIAQLVAILVFVLPRFGIDVVDANALTSMIAAIVGIIATVWVFIGRWRAGGITIFGLRKD